ncbi:hypothetical protein HMI56_005283, partial [Coelomomyces lativittatus]
KTNPEVHSSNILKNNDPLYIEGLSTSISRNLKVIEESKREKRGIVELEKRKINSVTEWKFTNDLFEKLNIMDINLKNNLQKNCSLNNLIEILSSTPVLEMTVSPNLEHDKIFIEIAKKERDAYDRPDLSGILFTKLDITSNCDTRTCGSFT